jgi:hypothetical protein
MIGLGIPTGFRSQRMRDRRRTLASIGAWVALATSGCGTASLPTLPPLPVSAAYSETPVEIYSRIASGAMSCWFASSGPLKRTHIFHADVAPPSDNAGAEIVIHERDNAAASPRSLRAFRIEITRAPEGTFVKGENLKLPEPLATSMQEDIKRWASGGSGCSSTAPEAWAAKSVQPNEMSTGTVPVSTSRTKQR